MPALEAFGRRWHVGTDDFVLPGICDLIIRISWFIATAVVYWQNSDELENGCTGGEFPKYFLYGVFAVLQLIIFSDIALVHNSKAGSVMDTGARKHVPVCLYVRTFLVVLEIALNSVGTYWFSQGMLTCTQAPSAETLVNGLIICNWLLVAFTLILFLIMFDTLGTHDYDLSQDIFSDPKLAKCWSYRWRFVCLYWWTKNKDVKRTFSDMGGYMAAAFESSNIVLSDLICGFILLYLKNREMRKNQLHSVSVSRITEESSSGDDGEVDIDVDSRTSNSNMSGVDWLKTEEWNNLSMIHHYYQYAVACYSWGVVLCTSRNPLWALWKDTFCCGCIRKNPYNTEVEGDSCCFIHSESARDVIPLENVEIIYCNFHDRVYQTPFLVALDHGQRSIVVAIRGTMSQADIITDIYVRPVSLARFGYPESFRVHQGMFMNALKVHEKLEETQMISKLLASYPGYKIVTTGTSLGSASATLLGLILKKEFPQVDLKTFAYSPSGALMNLETSKFCESFVTAIIYGDDFVARLAVKSIERLKYDVISILKECKTPKYQILLGGLFGLCGCRPKVSFSPDMESIRRESRLELITECGFDYSDINVVPMEGEKCPFYLNPTLEAHSKQKQGKSKIKRVCQQTSSHMYPKLLAFELMYPPGKLLHITETSAFRSGRRSRSDPHARWHIRWADRIEFRQILVSSRMVMDHVPFRQNKALSDLSRRWSQMSRSNAQVVSNCKTLIAGNNCSSSLTSMTVPVPIDDLVLPPIKPVKDALA